MLLNKMTGERECESKRGRKKREEDCPCPVSLFRSLSPEMDRCPALLAVIFRSGRAMNQRLAKETGTCHTYASR